MTDKVVITTPVGRMVQGSVSKPNTKDMNGQPMVVKTGPNKGQPTQQFFIALAIPKGPETHWASTPWGAEIWKVGHAAFPGVAQRPDFAWKITDGDSTIPNKRNTVPAQQTGFARHWVLKCTSSFPPTCWNANGTAPVAPESIKCGFFLQLSVTVNGNGNQQNPGVYLNCGMVALAAYGEEIQQGPDPTSAGFGGAPLPAGASMTPPAGMPAGTPAPGAPGYPPAPGAPVLPPGYVQPPAPGAPVYPPAPVQPAAPVPANPAILAVPGAPAAPAAPAPMPPAPPAAPAAPVAPAGPQMTAKAGGVAYAQFIAQGWNDTQLREQGYMV